MSLPIAVQCEKLLSRRYTLLDYILRALIKSCAAQESFGDESVDVLLFEDNGRKQVALADVGHQTIYQLASRLQEKCVTLDGFAPNLILCDSNTAREQVRAQLESSHRARYAMVVRGGSPKVGIQVGSKVTSMDLAYTFYVSSGVPRKEADHTAARLSALLYDPVSLLFIP